MAIQPDGTVVYTPNTDFVPSDPPESNNGILCGMLEVDNDGFVAFGIFKEGRMRGSQAVVGVPNENRVQKYQLVAGNAILLPEEQQTLRDTSIETDDTGKTTMRFTKLLVEEGENPIFVAGENKFLHSRGGAELGYHTFMGRFSYTWIFAATPVPTYPVRLAFAPPLSARIDRVLKLRRRRSFLPRSLPRPTPPLPRGGHPRSRDCRPHSRSKFPAVYVSHIHIKMMH